MKANNEIRPYTAAGTIISKGCNAIAFVNQGDITAMINGSLKIAPGATFAIGQTDKLVSDETTYTLNFVAGIEGEGTNRNLVVITTFLTHNCK